MKDNHLAIALRLLIHRVAIHSNHAGKGYATKLLTEVINYIKEHRSDIDSIRIDTHESAIVACLSCIFFTLPFIFYNGKYYI